MAKKTNKQIRKKIRKTKNYRNKSIRKSIRGGGGNPLYGMNNNYNSELTKTNGYVELTPNKINPETAKIVSALGAAKAKELFNEKHRIQSPLQFFKRAHAAEKSILRPGNEAPPPPPPRLSQHLPKQHTQSPPHLLSQRHSI